MKKYIDRFHYLTQDDIPGFNAIEQARTACEAGARWIQYRALPKSENELIAVAREIAAICDDWGATLIINDHAHLADRVDMQGVHIGRNDMHPAEARKMVGDDKVIGASALNLDDVKYFMNYADYLSIGPYHHTETKKTAVKPKGKNGIEDFIISIHQRFPGFDLPLIVAGGITVNDVEDILQTEVHGIAVSSAINKSESPKQTFREFYKKIY